MKLEILKSKEIKPKVIIILGIIVVSLIGMIIYQSYALFKLNESHNIVDSEVGTFSTGDIKILSVYVDGDKVNTFPAKTDDKVYEKIECTNSGIGIWDETNWKLSVSGITEPTSCNVYFKTYDGPTQTIASGDIRVDYDINMIPVAYTSSGATVKADTTNTDVTYKWFDYSAKRWANAVLVVDSKRETYRNATVATVIAESDILGYFVYIPRYRYYLFNAAINGTSSIQTINVVFENKSTTKSSGSTNGTWLTHPAFTFGSTELNGIWVGKFENSAEDSSSCYTASSTTNCNITAITPRVKPNKNSWRYINVSNMFTTNRYFKSNPIYGISNSSIDSHMMKNMEWGAVVYLTRSQYGRNSYLFINDYMLTSANYYNMLTGCLGSIISTASTTTCSSPYPSVGSTAGASTTGTIYGIYDMSGASYEYTMGNMVDSSGAFYPSQSGFATTWGASNTKYYDSYVYETTNTGAASFSRGKLGDATRETLNCSGGGACGWDGDGSLFPQSTQAWFARGGSAYNTPSAGVFSFNANYGGASSYYSSRAVLVVE